MPSNPTYYDGDLRRDLLVAALRAVERGGPASVSLRSLARSLGVSHAAPANHFGDKAGLFAAIAVEGFRGLARAIAAEPGSDRRLGAGVAYVRFALEHPAYFAVMWNAGLHGGAAEVERASDEAFAMLLSSIEPGSSPDPCEADVEDLASRGRRAWAVAHGYAALLIAGALRPPPGADVMDYVTGELRRFTIQ